MALRLFSNVNFFLRKPQLGIEFEKKQNSVKQCVRFASPRSTTSDIKKNTSKTIETRSNMFTLPDPMVNSPKHLFKDQSN